MSCQCIFSNEKCRKFEKYISKYENVQSLTKKYIFSIKTIYYLMTITYPVCKFDRIWSTKFDRNAVSDWTYLSKNALATGHFFVSDWTPMHSIVCCNASSM